MNQQAKDGERKEKTRGRKRDPGRTGAILEAALKVLLEVGYDHFRIQDVAVEAGCGTGAIYRRWSSKEALVAEAIRNMEPRKLKRSDDALADLKTTIHKECLGHQDKPDRVPGLVSAMRAHPDIGAAVREGYSLDSFKEAFERVLGPEHPQLSLLSEIVPAVCLLRASFAPESLNADEMTEQVLELVQTMVDKR